MNRDAYDAGYNAYWKRDRLADNPYDANTDADAFKSWKRGWFKAGRKKGAAGDRAIVLHMARPFLRLLVIAALVVPVLAGMASAFAVAYLVGGRNVRVHANGSVEEVLAVVTLLGLSHLVLNNFWPHPAGILGVSISVWRIVAWIAFGIGAAVGLFEVIFPS